MMTCKVLLIVFVLCAACCFGSKISRPVDNDCLDNAAVRPAIIAARKMIRTATKKDWIAYGETFAKAQVNSEREYKHQSVQKYLKDELPAIMNANRGKYNDLIGSKLVQVNIISDSMILLGYNFSYKVKTGIYSEKENVWVSKEGNDWKIQFFGPKATSEPCYRK